MIQCWLLALYHDVIDCWLDKEIPHIGKYISTREGI